MNPFDLEDGPHGLGHYPAARGILRTFASRREFEASGIAVSGKYYALVTHNFASNDLTVHWSAASASLAGSSSNKGLESDFFYRTQNAFQAVAQADIGMAGTVDSEYEQPSSTSAAEHALVALHGSSPPPFHVYADQHIASKPPPPVTLVRSPGYMHIDTPHADKLWLRITAMLLFCVVFSQLLPFYLSTTALIEDRSMGLKETLRCFGMQDRTYYVHWMLTQAGPGVVFAATMAILLFATQWISASASVTAVFFFTLSLYMSLQAMAFAWSCMWSTTSSGGLSGCVIFAAPIMYHLAQVYGNGRPFSFGTGIFLPYVNYVSILTRIILTDLKQPEVDDHGDFASGRHSFTQHVCASLMSWFLYLLVWYYLDQTIRHPNCSRQKPWFLCTKRHWREVIRWRRGERSLEMVQERSKELVAVAAQNNINQYWADEDDDDDFCGGYGAANYYSDTTSLASRMDAEEIRKRNSSTVSLLASPGPYGVRRAVSSPLAGRTSRALAVEEVLTPDEVRARVASLKEKINAESEGFYHEKVADERLLRCEVLDKIVRVTNLEVKYKRAQVLNGVNLKMYPGEIFVLLGHNGAGKSTTMKVLAGYISEYKGQVEIFKYKNVREMRECGQIGYCPQHVVLWDDLTVVEHLKLFSALKVRGRRGAGQKTLKSAAREAEEGATSDASSEDPHILSLLRRLDLFDSKDVLVRNLSGGLQRLLTVGLSFVGDPRFVILDEPTAGVDPITTTKIWDFLHQMKHSRVIMLTTHCMVEAERISDRVGIMKNGRIEAWGGSAFLKKRFECGYKLLLELNAEYFLQSKCHSAKLLEKGDPFGLKMKNATGGGRGAGVVNAATKNKAVKYDAYGRVMNPGNNIADMQPFDDDSDDGFNFLLGPGPPKTPKMIGGGGGAARSAGHMSFTDAKSAAAPTLVKDREDLAYVLRSDYFPTLFVEQEEFYDRSDHPLFPLYKIKTIVDEEVAASDTGAGAVYELHQTAAPSDGKNIVCVKLNSGSTSLISQILTRLRNEMVSCPSQTPGGTAVSGAPEQQDGAVSGGIGSMVVGVKRGNPFTTAKVVSKMSVENCNLGDVFLKIALSSSSSTEDEFFAGQPQEREDENVKENNPALPAEPPEVHAATQAVGLDQSSAQPGTQHREKGFASKHHLQRRMSQLSKKPFPEIEPEQSDKPLADRASHQTAGAVSWRRESKTDSDCSSPASVRVGATAVVVSRNTSAQNSVDRTTNKRGPTGADLFSKSAAGAAPAPQKELRFGSDDDTGMNRMITARGKQRAPPRSGFFGKCAQRIATSRRGRVFCAMLEMRWLTVRRDFKSLFLTVLFPTLFLWLGCHFYYQRKARILNTALRSLACEEGSCLSNMVALGNSGHDLSAWKLYGAGWPQLQVAAPDASSAAVGIGPSGVVEQRRPRLVHMRVELNREEGTSGKNKQTEQEYKHAYAVRNFGLRNVEWVAEPGPELFSENEARLVESIALLAHLGEEEKNLMVSHYRAAEEAGERDPELFPKQTGDFLIPLSVRERLAWHSADEDDEQRAVGGNSDEADATPAPQLKSHTPEVVENTLFLNRLKFRSYFAQRIMVHNGIRFEVDSGGSGKGVYSLARLHDTPIVVSGARKVRVGRGGTSGVDFFVHSAQFERIDVEALKRNRGPCIKDEAGVLECDINGTYLRNKFLRYGDARHLDDDQPYVNNRFKHGGAPFVTFGRGVVSLNLPLLLRKKDEDAFARSPTRQFISVPVADLDFSAATQSSTEVQLRAFQAATADRRGPGPVILGRIRALPLAYAFEADASEKQSTVPRNARGDPVLLSPGSGDAPAGASRPDGYCMIFRENLNDDWTCVCGGQLTAPHLVRSFPADGSALWPKLADGVVLRQTRAFNVDVGILELVENISPSVDGGNANGESSTDITLFAAGDRDDRAYRALQMWYKDRGLLSVHAFSTDVDASASRGGGLALIPGGGVAPHLPGLLSPEHGGNTDAHQLAAPGVALVQGLAGQFLQQHKLALGTTPTDRSNDGDGGEDGVGRRASDDPDPSSPVDATWASAARAPAIPAPTPLLNSWQFLHADEMAWSSSALAFAVSLVVCFLPSMSAARLENDVGSKTKLHMMLTGISHMQYWAAVFAWDFSSCMLIIVFFVALFLLYDIPFFGAVWTICGAANFVLIVFFLVATLSLVYVCSHFKNELLPRLIAKSCPNRAVSPSQSRKSWFVLLVFALNLLVGFMLARQDVVAHHIVMENYLKSLDSVVALKGSIAKAVEEQSLSISMSVEDLDEWLWDQYRRGIIPEPRMAPFGTSGSSDKAGLVVAEGDAEADVESGNAVVTIGEDSSSASAPEEHLAASSAAQVHAATEAADNFGLAHVADVARSIGNKMHGVIRGPLAGLSAHLGNQDLHDGENGNWDSSGSESDPTQEQSWVSGARVRLYAGFFLPAYPLLAATNKIAMRKSVLLDYWSTSGKVKTQFAALAKELRSPPEALASESHLPSILTNFLAECRLPDVPGESKCSFKDPFVSTSARKDSEVFDNKKAPGPGRARTPGFLSSSAANEVEGVEPEVPMGTAMEAPVLGSSHRKTTPAAVLDSILLSYVDGTQPHVATSIRHGAAFAGDSFFRSVTVGTELLQLLTSMAGYLFLLILATWGMRTVRDRGGIAKAAAPGALQVPLTTAQMNANRVFLPQKDDESNTLFANVTARLSRMLSKTGSVAGGRKGADNSSSDSDEQARNSVMDDAFPEAPDLSESDAGEFVGIAPGGAGGGGNDNGEHIGVPESESLLRVDALKNNTVDSKYALRKAGLIPESDEEYPEPVAIAGSFREVSAARGAGGMMAAARAPSMCSSGHRARASMGVSTTSSLRVLESEMAADAGVLREIARVRRMQNPEAQVLFMRNVKKEYPAMKTPAVANLHFAVSADNLKLPAHLQRGPTLAGGSGIFGLLGRNGAGKTTLFKLILRLEHLTDGELYILGEKSYVPYRQIGYCPQHDESLLMSLTVFENLRFYGQLKLRELYSNAKIQALIDELKLRTFQDKKCGHLSAGVQRKVCFAISLLGDPDILLLDEPGVGIDLFSKQSMWNAVVRHMQKPPKEDTRPDQGNGRLCLFTTNNMDEGNQLCNQIAIQVQGQWKCLGGLREFQEKYGGGYQVVCDFLRQEDYLYLKNAMKVEGEIEQGAGGAAGEGTGNGAGADDVYPPVDTGVDAYLQYNTSTATTSQNLLGGGAVAAIPGGSFTDHEDVGTFKDISLSSSSNEMSKTNSTASKNPFQRGKVAVVDEKTTVNNMNKIQPSRSTENKNKLYKNQNTTSTKRAGAAMKEADGTSKLLWLRKQQAKLLQDIESFLQVEYEVMETRGTQVVLRFPTITETSPLADVQALLGFFEERKQLFEFSFGQMQLKHIFSKFAGHVEI
eukprot:g2036.t1